MKTGRPHGQRQVQHRQERSGRQHQGHLPVGAGQQGPAAGFVLARRPGLFYVPTNHVCMDYEPFKVEYTAGQPYVGATLSMFPAPNSHGGMGNFIAWDAGTGKIVWSKAEKFSVWSGALVDRRRRRVLRHPGRLPQGGRRNTGKELWKFKTPSGIIGNVNTWEYKGKQYIGVLSGIGGWAGIGMAAGLDKDQRWPRRGRRLQGPGQVHQPGRHADGVRAAAEISRPCTPRPGSARCQHRPAWHETCCFRRVEATKNKETR